MDRRITGIIGATGLGVVLLLAFAVVSYAAGVGGGVAAYYQYCSACHGSDGTGTAYGPGIAGKSISEVEKTVRKGDREMPAFGTGTISDADLALLAEYVSGMQDGGAGGHQYGDNHGDNHQQDGKHDRHGHDGKGDKHGKHHDGNHQDRHRDGQHGDHGENGGDASHGQYGENHGSRDGDASRGQYGHGRPQLSLTVAASQWQSLAEYHEGMLTVVYRVENRGGDDAELVTIIAPTGAGAGAELVTRLPLSVGPVPAGHGDVFKLKYKVEDGVHDYRAIVHAAAMTADGTYYHYPESSD